MGKRGGKRAQRPVAIAAPAETAEIRFGETLTESEYRLKLEELQDSPRGSTLKICARARGTATKHIREMGLKVLWGKSADGEHLYIKIVGEVEPPLTVERALREPSPRPAPGGAGRNPVAGLALGMAEKAVLRALKEGPMVLKEVARALGAAPTKVADTLTEMQRRGAIECEDGVYRIKAA